MAVGGKLTGKLGLRLMLNPRSMLRLRLGLMPRLSLRPVLRLRPRLRPHAGLQSVINNPKSKAKPEHDQDWHENTEAQDVSGCELTMLVVAT